MRDARDARYMQPTMAAALRLPPPCGLTHAPATSATNKFVHVSTNKARCAINCVTWTPDGRRCLTGTQSGEFTLWNGTTFNFETIIQAHEAPIRCIAYMRSESFLISCDDRWEAAGGAPGGGGGKPVCFLFLGGC